MSSYKPRPYTKRSGWFEIPGFSQYAANRKGEVLNKKLGNSTQGGISGRYRKMSVYADGETKAKLRYTHNLICRAFHGPPKKGQYVLHKDNDRLNLKPSNLSWGTQSQNIKDMWDDGLREGKESSGADELKKMGLGFKDLAKSFGITLNSKNSDLDLDQAWECGYQLWRDNETSVLWIAGFEGSGKTTLAKKLSATHNVDCLDLDSIIGEIMENHPQLQQDVIKKEVRERIKSHQGRLIVEGVQSPLFIGDQSSFLLMKKGFVSSTMSTGKRRSEGRVRNTTLYGLANISMYDEMAKLKKRTRYDSQESMENLPPSADW